METIASLPAVKPQFPNPRVIRLAAALDTRYRNPSVVAMNRAQRLNQHPTVRVFWFNVMRALFRPYACQSWTDYDMRIWDAIRARQRKLVEST